MPLGRCALCGAPADGHQYCLSCLRTSLKKTSRSIEQSVTFKVRRLPNYLTGPAECEICHRAYGTFARNTLRPDLAPRSRFCDDCRTQWPLAVASVLAGAMVAFADPDRPRHYIMTHVRTVPDFSDLVERVSA